MRAQAIKNYDHYDKRVWNGNPLSNKDGHFHLTRRGSLHVLRAGDVFYVRPATSCKQEAFRVIIPDLGPTYVFSVMGAEAEKLLGGSAMKE